MLFRFWFLSILTHIHECLLKSIHMWRRIVGDNDQNWKKMKITYKTRMINESTKILISGRVCSENLSFEQENGKVWNGSRAGDKAKTLQFRLCIFHIQNMKQKRQGSMYGYGLLLHYGLWITALEKGVVLHGYFNSCRWFGIQYRGIGELIWIGFNKICGLI